MNFVFVFGNLARINETLPRVRITTVSPLPSTHPTSGQMQNTLELPGSRVLYTVNRSTTVSLCVRLHHILFSGSQYSHASTGICSEKCAVRRFCCRANVIECTSTHLDSIAHCTHRLYGIAYCC